MIDETKVKQVLACSDIAMYIWGEDLQYWPYWQQCFNKRTVPTVAGVCELTQDNVRTIRRLGKQGDVKLLQRVWTGSASLRQIQLAGSYGCSHTFFPGVYVLRCGELLKLGYSDVNPGVRAHEVATHTANSVDWDEIRVFTSALPRVAETALHAELEPYRVARKSRGGREWYYVGENLQMIEDGIARVLGGAIPIVFRNI